MINNIFINIKNNYYINNRDLYNSLLSKAEYRVYITSLWSLILGVLFPVINNGSTISSLVSLLSTFFAFISIILYYSINNRKKELPCLKAYIYIVIYMIFIGATCGWFFKGKTYIVMVITNDIKYVLLFWLGGIYSTRERYMLHFNKITYIISMIAIFMGCIAILIMFSKGIYILRDIDGNKIIYHLWWASTSCYAYCGYHAFFYKDKRNVYFSVFFVYFLLGIAFLKRSCFVNVMTVIVISCIILLFQKKIRNAIVWIFVFFIAFIIFYFILKDAIIMVSQLLFNRFNIITEDIDSFDRIVEWKSFVANSTLKQRLIGFGVGNYLLSLRYGIGNIETYLNAIHIGWANIIYKGGILYLIFYMYLYKNIIMNCFLIQNKSKMYIICLGVSISSLLSLFYEGSWTYTISPFFISAPLFYASSYTKN